MKAEAVRAFARTALQWMRQRRQWRAEHRTMRARARLMGDLRLPPGRLCPFDRRLWTDRSALLDGARRYGPLFKVVWNNLWMTVLIGHGRARRLLQANEDVLFSWTPDLRRLFPGGALREMQGDTHRHYRKVFHQALQATPLAPQEEALRGLIADGLGALARESTGPVSRAQITEALRGISTGLFVRLLLGVEARSPRAAAIAAAYRRFGADAPAYVIRAPEIAAFTEIRALVEPLVDEIRRDPSGHPPSVLRHLVTSGSLDPTAFGNLLYMLESSNHDVYSLWRWIWRHLGGAPAVVERLRALSPGSPDLPRLAEAVVWESLRLEQSEVLLRRVTADIAFEGHLLPAHSVLWVGIWEGHKDPAVFPDPYRFDPDRFLAREYAIEEYTPFGMDHRHCLGRDIVIRTGRLFVETLARDVDWTMVADGPPVRGPFHWEPSPRFSVAFAGRAPG